MGSRDYQREEVSASSSDSDIGRSHFLRQAARQIGILIASLLAGLAVRVAYRFLFDPAAEPGPTNFFRSRLQGARSPLAVLAVEMGFASGARSSSSSTLRRLPARRRTRRPSGRNGRRGDRG